MKFLKIFLLMSLLSLVACSGNKKDAEEVQGENTSEEISEDADFVVDADDEDLFEDEDESYEEDGEEIEVADSSEEVEVMEESGDEMGEEVVMEEEAPMRSAPEIEVAGNGTYTVKSGETMMMIAFKIYGDYTMWRKVANMNPGVDANSLSAGTVLKYSAPVNKFNWSPSGEPYLIKRNDTLGSISNDKYGTSSKWKDIWNNNRPLIKDPNLIFAGFTIYYVPGRDVASN